MVITPVMVPGLAAKRINGVSEGSGFEVAEAGAVDLPLSMEKPIQASTPPPATMKASRDTPNRCSSRVPISAAVARITSTASVAFVASSTCSPRERPAMAWTNIIPQIAGFTRDMTVTIA